MKKSQLLLNAIILIVLTFSLSLTVLSQVKNLPADLHKDSTVSEIINWLDKTSFAKARVGVHIDGNADQYEIPDNTTVYSEWAVFSQGYKLSKLKGCKIILRNDDVDLLQFYVGNPDIRKASLANYRKLNNDKTKFASELSISLDKLGYKAGKKPFRRTKKAEKAALLGTWQSTYRSKGGSFFSLPIFGFPSEEELEKLMYQFRLEIIGSGENGENEAMRPRDVTFTFDDKESSQKFDTAFRQAIKLCNEK